MKRLVIAALAIMGMFCFSIPIAEAAIDNTSHDLDSGSQGACSTCHIPHKSVGKRLWPSDMSAQETAFGVVGALCYYCHGPGSTITTAIANNIMNSATNGYSHGLTTGDIPAGGNGLAAATDLPYINQSSLQCTSCHDVHTDTNRPFLRRSYETLCQDCHSMRSVAAGNSPDTFPDWNVNAVGDNNAYGSHPVGPNITGDVSGGTSPISFGLTSYINMTRSNVADNWSLGGHLSSTSGVMCGTCHAPHGVDVDKSTGANTPELNPANDILVFGQGTGTTEDGGAANGDGDANNHLCESCHTRGATATWDTGTGANYAASSTWNVTNVGGDGTQGGTAAGTNYALQPNPGGTAFTHPVDDLGAAGATNVVSFGNAGAGGVGWPIGTTPGTNVGPAPICESCHTPHPRANGPSPGAGRVSISAATGSAILRNTAFAICGDCHGGAWADHHPIGSNIMTDRFNGTSSTGGVIGNGDANLTCGDCHNGAGGGAHNWAQAGVGLDPDWVPANNGRGAGDVVGGTNLPDNNAYMADSCKQCHMNTQAGTAHQSPTKNSGDAGGTVTHAWRTNSGYTDLGEGTHYLGDNVTGLYLTGTFAGSAFNATTDVWDCTVSTNGTAKGGWSRWYGKRGAVGCQSCHEIEPSKNVSGTALLLAWYKDGDTETNNVANDPAAFCQGCHGPTPGGGTPHPMTGSVIGRAVTAGRTPTTLITGSGAFIGSGAPTRQPAGGAAGTSTFPAPDAMSCDSCHQPHDAPTSGGTYIYEAPSANVTGTGGSFGTPSAMPARGSATTSLEDRMFCNQCHEY